ncbi:glycosyltransferase family 2 protein [Actinoplanes sp. G11-F43]|uniref:glycosyltransferase family 2 protein n=1 Tax=Actinoplanes sp. G11-F43 TaxID=3424130 RepID=UPI003D34512C
MNTDVTVVIPVRDDPLVFRCLASIDVDIPAVVVANGSTPEFLRLLEHVCRGNVRLVVCEQPGIGTAYNAGIAAADTDWVLLMDSDCVFRQGALTAMLKHADGERMVKGRVEFEGTGWQTRLTARARRCCEDPLLTGRVNAYSPPLLYPKAIVGRMDGRHFDDRLAWREDRDFELRRRKAGLPVVFEPDGVIVHKPLSIRQDLASVRSYGGGQRRGERLGILPRFTARHELRKVARIGRRAIRQDGPAVAAYSVSRYLMLWWARAVTR